MKPRLGHTFRGKPGPQVGAWRTGLRENPQAAGVSESVIVEVCACRSGRLFNIVKTSPRLGVMDVDLPLLRNRSRIMITTASRKISRTLSTLAVAALSVLGSSAMAEEELRPAAAPWGVYVGGNLGVGAAQWDCDAACDRARLSGKIFGGKRLTPGLAAEVNYMVFGGMDRANDTPRATATGINAERRQVRALTAGINWEVELLEGFTNQIRVGWAFKRIDSDLALVGGADKSVRDYRQAPYFGVGLAMNISRNVRLLQSFDYIIDGHESLYLFTVGASAEF